LSDEEGLSAEEVALLSELDEASLFSEGLPPSVEGRDAPFAALLERLSVV